MSKDIVCKNQHSSPSPSQCMEHYGCIYENNHLITLVVNPETGTIRDANRAACLFYGYELREFRKLHIADLNSLETERGLGHFLKQALAAGGGGLQRNRVFKERHQTASGQIIDVEIHTGLITLLGSLNIYTVIHDISDRVRSEDRLKESEERYRDLVELCPEAILVYSGGTILFANRQSEVMFGKPRNELLGQGIDAYFSEEDISSAEYNNLRSRGMTGKDCFRIEQRFVRYDGCIYDLEISGAPIMYEETKALQLVFRDITESKKEIASAVKLQEHRHAVAFPLEQRAELDKLYIPAAALSGDFFIFQKLDEQRVIGMIGDVTGKGITAALNISALKVLFSGSLLHYTEPVQVLQELNRKAMQFLGEDYTAVCCFHLDFSIGRLQAAGAGINEFLYVPQGDKARKMTVKGAPLGMFENSEFDQITLPFQSGDTFCFYSDGMDLLFNSDELCLDYNYLVNKICLTTLQDDCTWLSLKIK